MASAVDWKNLIETSSGSGRGRKSGDQIYLKIESGKNYRIRPVGGAVAFAKFFLKTQQGPKSAIVDLAHRDKLAMIVTDKLGTKNYGSKRFAMNVLDREDGKIKILEGGAQIFNHFAVWSSANNNSPPGAKEAMDWIIAAHGQGLDKQYTVTGVEKTTLSDTEVKYIKTSHHDLSKFYAGVSVEEAVQTLFGEDAAVDINAPDAVENGAVVSSASGPSGNELGF